MGGSVIGQDKVNTVSHRVPRQFLRKSLRFSHSARVPHTVCRTQDRPAPSNQRNDTADRGLRAPVRRPLLQIIWLGAGAILIVLLDAARGAGRVILVDTDSACPVGIYRVVRKPMTRGELVEACLPDAIATYGIARGYIGLGRCRNGAEPVIKLIGATAGDRVDLSRAGVWVNGIALPESATRSRDSRGREVPTIKRGGYQTRANDVWLFGLQDARSWDSRYYGPVPRQNVIGAALPLLTLGHFPLTK
jgi:conjugative transfer signal peptidase TraF